ncbi:MAG: HlyD family secretion protein [Kiritimatiellia bacterium]
MNATDMISKDQHGRKRLGLTWHRVIRNWPVLAWLLAIAAACFLYGRSARFGNLTGTVDSVVEAVAPLDTARLISIDVELGQHVKAGDILARLDTTVLDAELAEYEVARVESEGSMARDMLQMIRQFETAVKEAESLLAQTRMEQQGARGELDQLKKEYSRLLPLIEKRTVTEDAVAEIRPRMAALEEMTKSYPGLISIAEEQLQSARRDRDQLIEWIGMKKGEDIADAIARKMQARTDVLEESRAFRERERNNYVLRAANDGIVATIWGDPGEVIAAGIPVIRLVQEKSSRVLGYLPEVYVDSMKVGQKAWVWRNSSGSGSRVPAEVVAVSPEVNDLPTRMSPFANQIVRGRRVVLKLLKENDLVPGESVQIRTDSGRWF